MAAVIAALVLWLGGYSKLANAAVTPYDPMSAALTSSAWEATQRADNSFSFYNVPSNFSSSLAPGTLLGVEAATNLVNYTVPSSLTLSRILYVTEDVFGNAIPASGYVLWPYAKLPSHGHSGYPMVAWAHGTSGYFKPCAPSNYRSLQYHFMAPYALALQGMIVVAPDYAGLGVDQLPSGQKINHPWLTAPAQANDLANAILAARAAFPDYLTADGSFVAVGHSQGGATAWGFAERQAIRPIAGYKGTVALAPPTNYFDELDLALKNTSAPFASGIIGAQTRINAAVTAVYPAYNDSGMTPLAYDLWHNVFKKVNGCLPTDVTTFLASTPDQLSRPGWTNNTYVQQYSKIATVGNKKFAGPLLILQGEQDEVVAYPVVQAAAKGLCKNSAYSSGQMSLEMVSYQAMDHFSVIQASQHKWLSWVKDRLNGRGSAAKGCVFERQEGLRTDFTVKTTAPNFLVEWADPLTEFWKYVL